MAGSMHVSPVRDSDTKVSKSSASSEGDYIYYVRVQDAGYPEMVYITFETAAEMLSWAQIVLEQAEEVMTTVEDAERRERLESYIETHTEDADAGT